MIISNKIKFFLEKLQPAGVEIITLRKTLKRTVNWSWINLAGNTNKCMLPNGDERGLLHGPCEAEVCGGLLAARVAK